MRFLLYTNPFLTSMPLSDTQVFVALFVALITGILSRTSWTTTL